MLCMDKGKSVSLLTQQKLLRLLSHLITWPVANDARFNHFLNLCKNTYLQCFADLECWNPFIKQMFERVNINNLLVTLSFMMISSSIRTGRTWRGSKQKHQRSPTRTPHFQHYRECLKVSEEEKIWPFSFLCKLSSVATWAAFLASLFWGQPLTCPRRLTLASSASRIRRREKLFLAQKEYGTMELPCLYVWGFLETAWPIEEKMDEKCIQ